MSIIIACVVYNFYLFHNLQIRAAFEGAYASYWQWYYKLRLHSREGPGCSPRTKVYRTGERNGECSSQLWSVCGII